MDIIGTTLVVETLFCAFLALVLAFVATLLPQLDAGLRNAEYLQRLRRITLVGLIGSVVFGMAVAVQLLVLHVLPDRAVPLLEAAVMLVVTGGSAWMVRQCWRILRLIGRPVSV